MMSNINDTSIVKQQYATANNLNTRISIHEKYSTNKMGFGNWIVSNYRIDKGVSVLELGCGTGDMWRNRKSLIDSCSKLILSDISEGMTSLNSVPKQVIKDILMKNTINDVLNVPKEYGMFISS